jgi:hypothetical protein
MIAALARTNGPMEEMRRLQPGQMQHQPSKALGNMPQASPDVGQNIPAQGQSAASGVALPSQPTPAQMPH